MSRRLLIIVHEALFFTTHRLPVGRAMQARGWEVHIAAPPDAAIFARLAGEGFVMHPIALERSGINPLAELRLLLALWRLLRRLAPQLVHAVSMKPVIWGGIAARLARVPGLVLAITGLGSLFSRDTLKGSLVRFAILRLYGLALHHRHSCTIFQNPDDLALFQQQHLVRPGAWRMIKGCGVDMAAFAVQPEPPGLPVVMFPGRLLGDKGVHEFVAAARMLKQQGVEHVEHHEQRLWQWWPVLAAVVALLTLEWVGRKASGLP